jgi:hypothetical protein
LRFIAGIAAFNIISGIGYPLDVFRPFFEAPLALPITLLLGVIFVILPHSLSYGIMIVDIGIQLSQYTEIALLVTLFLLCVLFFYARLAPRESILILLTLAAFYFKIPYLVPILAGLYFSVTALIPISIGIFIWNFIPVVHELTQTTKSAGLAIMDMPETFGAILRELVSSVSGNQSWIFYSFIFAMVLLVVYGISRMSIDYSKDISVALGALMVVISFIIAKIMTGIDEDIFFVLVFTIISAGLAELVRFFDVVLDYGRAERVEFEDEENYYFVKVVPKVIMTRRNRVLRSKVRRAEPDSGYN